MTTEMFSEYPEVIGIEEIQRMLNISKALAYRLIRSGSLKAVKIGREYRLRKSEVIAYLRREQ